MTSSYLEKRNIRLQNNKEKDNFIFGLIIGLVLIILNLYLYLRTESSSSQDAINLCIMIIGIIIISIAIIYPNLLNPAHKVFKFVFNIIGKLLMTVLLTIIYFVLVYPIGLILRDEIDEDSNTTFTDYDGNIELCFPKRLTILKIFKMFSDEKYALMLPLIIVLVILSVLLIFVQSSVITPFIYTLF